MFALCRIDVEALQGDSKAISTDHNAVEFSDMDDDAMQLQKAAAVIFGFSGLCLQGCCAADCVSVLNCHRPNHQLCCAASNQPAACIAAIMLTSSHFLMCEKIDT